MELNVFEYHNWVTCILLLPIFIVSVLCFIDLKKAILLYNVTISKIYFYRHKPINAIFTSSFYLIKTLLLVVLLTFVFWVSYHHPQQIFSHPVETFFKTLFWVGVYYTIKVVLIHLSRSFINNEISIKEIKVIEESYLVSVLSFLYLEVVYLLLHLKELESSVGLLVYSGVILFFLRAFTMVVNNKNLMSGQLLYFILYLCILELFPFIYFLSIVHSN